MIDKDGNDGADKLACDGAALHAVVASEAKARFATAKTVQSMMTHILEARLAAERADSGEPDHGSDTGDFFGIDFDRELSHADTSHENSVDFAFVRCSHVVHDDQCVVDHRGDLVGAFESDSSTCPIQIVGDFELEPLGGDGRDCNHQCEKHNETDPAFVSASAVAFDLDDDFDNGSDLLSAVG